MKGSQYLALFVRLFSIALVVYVARELIMVWNTIREGEISGIPISPIFMSFTLIVPLCIALLLWMFPTYISRRIFRNEMDGVVSPLAPIDLLGVIIAGVGVFYLYYSFMDAAYWIVFAHMAANSYEFDLDPQSKIDIGVTILEFVVALALILKAKSIAKIVAKVAS